jgi:beta-glucanase (GH16 family)
MRIFWKCSIYLLGALALTCATARADSTTRLLFDPTAADASACVQANHSTFTIDSFPTHKAIQVIAEKNQSFPGVTVGPTDGVWNLSEFKGISAEITNLSSDAESFTLRVDEDTDWSTHPNPWNAMHVVIDPGASMKIETLFGENYGTEGYPTDATRIKRVLIFLDEKQNATRKFLIDHVEAIQNPDASEHPFFRPNMTGLIAWFDASRPDTVQVNERGHLSKWHDRTALHDDLMPMAGTGGPELVSDGINGRPSLRFEGTESVAMDNALRREPESVTIVVVWKPIDGAAKGPMCLAASLVDRAVAPNAPPNFQLVATASSSAPTISFIEQSHLPIGRLAIGGLSAPLHADLAEVLIYDRAFVSEGERQITMNYLSHKWGAEMPESGWTRKGGLGATPKRVTDRLPLSDQKNSGEWTLDPAFTDEFKGAAIDQKKWRVFTIETAGHGDWVGREPAMFMRHNVVQADGELQLTFRKEEVPLMKVYKGYAGYTSAYITTRQRTGYGYYEICAKPMNSAASSSFWFTDTADRDHSTEIDVFEMGAKGQGFERNYNMTIHVWSMPNDKRHWGIGGVWQAPWNLGDDYHVYGFDWNKDQLVWYVDGVPVHTAKNTNWFYPMKMILDSEAMWSWFGKVNDADLPSTFRVKYVRTWRSNAPETQVVPEEAK